MLGTQERGEKSEGERNDNSSRENIKLRTAEIPDVFLHLQTQKREKIAGEVEGGVGAIRCM